MNKHIYKVIKWLEDPDSVSKEERDKNREESDSAFSAAANDISFLDAAAAAYFAAENNQESATKWVNKYFEITGENKQDYLDAIEEEKVGSKKEPATVYVKEYKGLSVPSGATHYSEDGETITFYRVGAPRVERYSKPLCAADDPWSSCLSNPTNEIPKIEEEKVLTDANKELSERVKVIGREDYFYTEIEDFEKQPRYKGNDGLDWIDEFSRDNSIEDFRAAMRFTIGKYEKRLGKKDAMSKELYKISDYYKRWSEVEKKLEGE
jgi:hypothetical protein